MHISLSLHSPKRALAMIDASASPDAPAKSNEAFDEDTNSLRGTMVSVITMGLFFMACWGGVWMLYLYRR